MSQALMSFDDGGAYERFMGRWSRAAGSLFLDWMAAAPRLNWLDVGCGTGILTELILERCAPAAVFGADPNRGQIDYVKRQSLGHRATLRVAPAETLPFSNAVFDVVVSALVINFLSDRREALREMRRVARPGGTIAGFVWDFEAERSPSGPLRATMRRCGIDIPDLPGTETSNTRALSSLFEDAGLRDVVTTHLEMTLSYPDFESFWDAQTTSYSPTTRIIKAMPAHERAALMDRVRDALPLTPGGAVEYAARANAVKGVKVSG